MKKHYVLATIAAAVAALALTVLAGPSMATVYYYDDGTTYDTHTNRVTDTSDGSYYDIETGERYNSWTGEYTDANGHKYRKASDNDGREVCAKLSDAENVAGFEFGSDIRIDDMKATYTVIGGDTIQIKFHNRDNDIIMTKSTGTVDMGTVYNVMMTETISGVTDIVMRGNNRGYYYAVWNLDGYSCSIKSRIPLTMTEMDELARLMIFGY